MMNLKLQRDLDDLARDLDLLAFRLEQPTASPAPEDPSATLRAVRDEVDRLARRLRELADRAAGP